MLKQAESGEQTRKNIEREAKAFTRDLAEALATPMFDDGIEISIYDDFFEATIAANRKLSTLLSNCVFGTKKIKYHVAIVGAEDGFINYFKAIDNRGLVGKMDIICPNRYNINNLSEEDSRKLFEKIKTKY